MLWMLGVVAILVDVVARFAGTNTGGGNSTAPEIAIPQPHKPAVNLTQPKDVDVTYVVINEKKMHRFDLSSNSIDQDPDGDDDDHEKEAFISDNHIIVTTTEHPVEAHPNETSSTQKPVSKLAGSKAILDKVDEPNNEHKE